MVMGAVLFEMQLLLCVALFVCLFVYFLSLLYLRQPSVVRATFAVCCSMLQCVAVCCRVLQYVAVSCSVLQRASLLLSGLSLQQVAICFNALQCVAVCRSVL